ncbi:CRTAC1 family protein [Candidatus Kaiserbacteria bacterium]|nr:CRTAC1 family protein [Candidatus Kaiserbacteria bacterium]
MMPVRIRYPVIILAVCAVALAGFLLYPRHYGFRDVIADSGLSTAPSSGGVAWGDYNGDGYLDLLTRLPNMPGYRLYRNNGNGTFTDVTEEAKLTGMKDSAFSAAFGDYDNDGCEDIFVTNGETLNPKGETDSLYHNNCDGTFTDVSVHAGIRVSAHSKGITWGDYDNDGYLDVYVATYGVLLFDKSETAWKVTGSVYEPNMLYHNNGDGTFTNVAKKMHVEGLASCSRYRWDENVPRAERGQSGYVEGPLTADIRNLKNNWQPLWFDYDNDGKQDLYVTHETAIDALYHNNGDGSFTDVTEKAGLCRKQSTHGIAVGDFDGDGYQDLYLGGSLRNIYWHNNRDGTFEEMSEDAGVADFKQLGWGVGTLDFNNDGLLDLYAINGSTHNASFMNNYPDRRDRLYLNSGGGRFSEVGEQFGITGNVTKSTGAFGDYNNDGFTDVYVNAERDYEPDAKNRLYEGVPNGNHYLTVKLVGTKSNRDGVGARIEVAANNMNQVREVTSGGSYLSQNSLWQNFGLGTARTVDTLTIHWPSGVLQTLHDIRADRSLTVREEP